MFSSPALILTLLLASTYAVAFHLLQGRGCRYLFVLWIVSILGFICGHVVGALLDVIPWTIGPVHVIEGTLVSLLFLVFVTWLSREPKTE